MRNRMIQAQIAVIDRVALATASVIPPEELWSANALAELCSCGNRRQISKAVRICNPHNAQPHRGLENREAARPKIKEGPALQQNFSILCACALLICLEEYA